MVHGWIFYIGKVADLRRLVHMRPPRKGAKVIVLADRLRYQQRMKEAGIKSLRAASVGSGPDVA